MSAEDFTEPAPANWRRVSRRGALQSSILPTTFTGWIEAPVFATNFDCLIDFGSATYDNTTSFFAALYVQASYGAGKVYRAQYRFQPSTGIIPAAEPTGFPLNPAWSTMVQSGGVGGLQFLLHAGGLAAVTSGLELCAISLAVGPAVEI